MSLGSIEQPEDPNGPADAGPSPRARDLGLAFGGRPGPVGAITDVGELEVGYRTLVHDRADDPGAAARSGVTGILPRGRAGVGTPCAAGVHSFNGNGELTGRSWIEESGSLNMPIALTNSQAIGACHQGVDTWVHQHHPGAAAWMLPVVAETWDGYLNDIHGGHVRPADAQAALDTARPGPIAEGSVGGGTGMNCYEFKGGTGTSSRLVDHAGETYTVGALIQANFGGRHELTYAGIPIGARSTAPNPMALPWTPGPGSDPIAGGAGAGSAIIVIATDAPLLPGQCAALARRAPLGLARTGTTGSHFSGDIMVAFSTANSGALTSQIPQMSAAAADYEWLSFVPWGRIDPFYTAVVEAVEEAIWNVLVAARDMTGRHGHFSPALPHDEIRAAAHPRPA